MAGAKVVNIRQLVRATDTEIRPYGRKSAGYVNLYRRRPNAPVPYRIPDAHGIPARGAGTFTRRDIQGVFADLTAGRGEPGALMARSSGLHEAPGANPTRNVLFDPTDKLRSFRRFANAIDEILGVSDEMGVLATRMAGSVTRLEDSRPALGVKNVSFVADTHNPMHPEEIHLALVHGLGTRAVEPGSDFIPVGILRENGLVTYFGNKTEQAILTEAGTVRAVFHGEDYRQGIFDYFDLERGEVTAATPPNAWFESRRMGRTAMVLRDGALLLFRETDTGTEDQLYYRDAITGTPKGYLLLGITPFQRPTTLTHLVSLLQYFARTNGPTQIEGTFVDPRSDTPTLYQSLDVPPDTLEATPLSLTTRHCSSPDVMGKARFRGPLVYFTKPFLPEDEAICADLERWLGKKGYIVLANSHSRWLLSATPGCRLRLSLKKENLSSHPVTLTRLKIAEDPNGGYVLAMDVDAAPLETALREQKIRATRTLGDEGQILLFDNAILEANGSELAVAVQR